MNKKLVNRVLLLGLAAMLSLFTACSVSLTKQPSTSEPAEPPAEIIRTNTQHFDTQKSRIHESRSQASETQEINTQTSETYAKAAEESAPASLVEDLKTVLATELGVASSEVLVKEATAVEWSDACLGAATPDEMCAQVITPGYRVVLSTLTDEFEFHTDRTGKHFRRVRPEALETELEAETRQEPESGE